MVWLLALLIIRIVYPMTSDSDWKSLIVDAGLISSLIYLARSHQISRALEAWNVLKSKHHDIMRRQLNLALTSDLLRLISLPFAGMWLWRWRDGWMGIFENRPSAREFNYVDAFLFCLFLAYLLDTEKFRQSLLKMQMTSGRQVLIQYTAAILAGTFLLEMPMSLNPGQSLSIIDALFVTVSALSVTGLSPVDVSAVFSLHGQVILLGLIQLGGLGIVLITAGFSFMTYKRLSMNSILLGREMYNTCRTGEVPEFLTRVVALTLSFELLGAVSLYFNLPHDTPNRIFTAIFHSVSAFCNAGFSTFSTGLHETPFSIVGVITICFLIILGGMGFPILLDIWTSLQKRDRHFRILSPHARLTLYVMTLLLILGPIVFFILETLRPTAELNLWTRLGQSLFYSISSRTAGFGMIPLDTFHPSALFWIILLMAIGANPSSTGGGIKTTTVGVLISAVIRTIQGHRQTTFNGRAIPLATMSRALTVVALYLFVAGVAIMLLVITERAHPFSVAFEVFSALSTVGLSLGITAQFSVFGKITLMFLMLFGRIGILSFLLAGIGRTTPSKVKYPEDDFFVG